MTNREAELLAEIRTRGHWVVVVRPDTFIEHRLERTELFEIVENSRIDLRGWDFPHVDRDSPPDIDVEWVGQQIKWEHILEMWRMYRSGQLVSISGIPFDWRDNSKWWPRDNNWTPNTLLGITDVIARLTEVLEFAMRFSQTRAGEDTISIAIVLKKMKGRVLFPDMPGAVPLWRSHKASVDEIPLKRTLSRADLLGQSAQIAQGLADEVFSFFGWTPEAQIIADVQKQLIGRRRI